MDCQVCVGILTDVWVCVYFFVCLVNKKYLLLGLYLLLLPLADEEDLLLGLCLYFWDCDFWILILYYEIQICVFIVFVPDKLRFQDI